MKIKNFKIKNGILNKNKDYWKIYSVLKYLMDVINNKITKLIIFFLIIIEKELR